MNTLFIRLEGPLQSWGLRARWTERDTALEPTKSAVTGLLAGTLGWGIERDDDIRALAAALRFGVRVDCPGRVIRDYQTVFGGTMAANRKIKRTESTGERETVVSPRWYLSDSSFLVALQSTTDQIEMLSRALQDPVWPPYLGRKSCPPSLHPWEGAAWFAQLTDALGQWPRTRRAKPGSLRAVVETGPGGGIRRQDQIDTLSRRTYRPRYARDILVDPPYPDEG